MPAAWRQHAPGSGAPRPPLTRPLRCRRCSPEGVRRFYTTSSTAAVHRVNLTPNIGDNPTLYAQRLSALSMVFIFTLWIAPTISGHNKHWNKSQPIQSYKLNTYLLTYCCRAFSVAGPTVWNSLPDFIRGPTIIRLLKTYLFARY